jgi:gas vesicle protein
MKTNREFYFPSFIVGMALGTLAGLLLALRPGEETRKYVRERSNKSLDYVNEQAAKLRRAAEALVEAGESCWLVSAGLSRPIPKPKGRPMRKKARDIGRIRKVQSSEKVTCRLGF